MIWLGTYRNIIHGPISNTSIATELLNMELNTQRKQFDIEDGILIGMQL
jgi:hypothetical protein